MDRVRSALARSRLLRVPRRARGDGGQMMLLSGVLLLLGFVVLGTTMVQLQGLEGSTERTQRDSLMNTAEELIAGLNQTIRDSIVIGETNVTGFQETLRNAEANLRDNAVRSGVYASVELSMEPIGDLTDVFWRPSRCIGYNHAGSEDGVILGWEKDTFKETIAGAVYDIHITDGRQSFRSLVYVRVTPCAEIEITSTHKDPVSAYHGGVGNDAAMRKVDGVAATFREELDHETLVAVDVHPTINESTIDIERWNKKDGILHPLDLEWAEMPSRAASLPDKNHFRFQLNAPQRMAETDTLPNLTVEIMGFKALIWTSLYPQDMYLRVYENKTALDAGVPAIDQRVRFPTGTQETMELVLENLTGSGEDDWTYQQIIDTRWEFAVYGTHYPAQQYYVDHFNMTGSILMAEGYRLNVTFDWQDIPEQYADHELHMRYRVDPTPQSEGYRLLVRDRDGVVDGGNWTEVHNMTDTTGEPDGWRTIQATQSSNGTDWFDLPNRAEFRILDTVHNDNWIPDDQDTVRIDYIYIKSHLQD